MSIHVSIKIKKSDRITDQNNYYYRVSTLHEKVSLNWKARNCYLGKWTIFNDINLFKLYNPYVNHFTMPKISSYQTMEKKEICILCKHYLFLMLSLKIYPDPGFDPPHRRKYWVIISLHLLCYAPTKPPEQTKIVIENKEDNIHWSSAKNSLNHLRFKALWHRYWSFSLI